VRLKGKKKQPQKKKKNLKRKKGVSHPGGIKKGGCRSQSMCEPPGKGGGTDSAEQTGEMGKEEKEELERA